jgi:hypothetical protein
MDVMEKNHGGHECTGFLMQDLYNFFEAQEAKNRREGCSECAKPYESDV